MHWTAHDTSLVIWAVVAIAVVVILITWFKLHPFLALVLGSAVVGLGSGLAAADLIKQFEAGFGSTLGGVGTLVALGTILGKLLADSGGADRIVDTIVSSSGPRRLPWAMALIAMIIGLPMFFEVGLVLLIPVIFLVSKRANTSIVRVGIPALAGLSVMHGLVPPHPGPLLAITAIHADLGRTLGFGLLVAIPTVIIAGPLYGMWIGRRVTPTPPARLVAEFSGGGALAATGPSRAQSTSKGVDFTATAETPGALTVPERRPRQAAADRRAGRTTHPVTPESPTSATSDDSRTRPATSAGGTDRVTSAIDTGPVTSEGGAGLETGAGGTGLETSASATGQESAARGTGLETDASGAGLETGAGPGTDARTGVGDRGERSALAGTAERAAAGRPSFATTLCTVLLPVVLMLAKALADILIDDKKNALRSFLDFVGDPFVALLLAVIVALFTFGVFRRFSRERISEIVAASFPPIAGLIFIIGAGGGFKQTLIAIGIGDAIGKAAAASGISILLLGWLIAVGIRLATGSATVATVTAAGLIAPLLGQLHGVDTALLALAIGSGSLFLSHVNDAGFWLVKEYFGMTVGETFKTWSVMETIISVVSIVLIMLLSVVT
jgi:GntP family gluconate:H+ symporter